MTQLLSVLRRLSLTLECLPAANILAADVFGTDIVQ